MTLDIHQILRQLPHRYPFLMVDRVLALEHGQRIKAVKNGSLIVTFLIARIDLPLSMERTRSTSRMG